VPGTLFQESYTYNTAGEMIAFTDGRGNTTQYAYEARGLLSSETLPDPDGAGSQFSLVVNYGYDNMGRMTSIDRGFGRVTTAATIQTALEHLPIERLPPIGRRSAPCEVGDHRLHSIIAVRREPSGLKWSEHGVVLRASTRMLGHLG
jgi:YD repeat-containing protein